MATKKPVQKSVPPLDPSPAPAEVIVMPTPAEPRPSYHLVALQVENIKRVTAVTIRPKGHMITVSGKNGSGKSSILESLSMLLTGEKGMPSMPIRKGQKTARIEGDFGDIKVRRTFTRIDGGREPFLTRLEVYGKHRESFPTPQSVLDAMRGVISFDPLSFIQMKPAQQLEALRKLVTLDVDLDALEREKKEAYEERRQVGREVDSAKARLRAFVAPAEDLPEKPIDTIAITGRLEMAAADNDRRARLLRKQKTMEEESGQAKKRAFDAAGRAADLRRQAEEMDKVSETEVDESTRIWNESQAIIIPEEVITAELAAELQQANRINNSLQVREAYRSVERQIAEAEARWEKFDASVKALEASRAEAIARAKMPIEKLSIGEGEVLYDGLPFAQASNGEQIRITVAMAMATDPQLRIMILKDGSLLDDDALAMIGQMAADNDFQIMIERVESTGKVGIVMTDGEASGEEVEQVSHR